MVNPEMRFLIKLDKLDLPPAIGNKCMDNVTLWQTPSERLDVNATVVSHMFEATSSGQSAIFSIYVW